MPGPTANYGVLFRYRLLVQTGYLDDDVYGVQDPHHHQPARRIAVDEELCVGCFACRTACPTSAIRVWDDLAHIIDPLTCPTCVDTPCIGACPTDALSDRGPRNP